MRLLRWALPETIHPQPPYTRRMKTTLRILLAVALLALAACGNKGELVLPDKPSAGA